MSDETRMIWPADRTVMRRRCNKRLREDGIAEIGTETSYRVGPAKDEQMDGPVI